ncbi:MAG: hypothetical protein KDA59_21430, partial [Planctomycetales bacterium]|nr:hypothetical protein [Planctomycetales bacterium]
DGSSSGLRWVRTGDWKLYNDGRLFHMNVDEREQYTLSTADDTAEDKAARQQLLAAFRQLGLSGPAK